MDRNGIETGYHSWLLSRHYSKNHADSSKLSARRVLEYMEKENLREAETLDGQQFLAALLDHARKERGYTERSIDTFADRAAAFLRWLNDYRGWNIPGLSREKVKKDFMESYPEEFRRLYAEYYREREFAGTPVNSLNKIGMSIRRWYDHLLSRGIVSLQEVKKEDAREFSRYLASLPGKDGGSLYCPVSVNRTLSDVKVFLLWLSKKGLCAGHASRLTNLKEEEKVSRNVFTRKELARFLAVGAETPFEFMLKTLMVLLYSSGVRVGEALGLKLSSIDLERHSALIYESKTKKERAVLFGGIAGEYLKLYLKTVRPILLKNPADMAMLFVSPRLGGKLTPDAVNKYIGVFCSRAGIKKNLSCHCFRHSYGTHLLENGAGIRQVSELLGHEKLSTTERYTRLSPERLRETVRNFHPLERRE